MRFLSKGIGKLVLEELGRAIEARVAVAFFNPNDRMLEALAGLTKLELIVSEEFTITNPYKLERLKAAKIRSIPPDDVSGKLHAKVLIVKRRNGSYWTLLGSANLTHQGMFSNQEACIALESGNAADEGAAREIGDWFDLLFEGAEAPDLERAKLIFDARSQYRLVSRRQEVSRRDVGYWVLKTTSGSTGKQQWPMFLAENVIAIGWAKLDVDPSKVSDVQLRNAIRNTYPDEDAKRVATKIKKFVDLKVDDIILLCRGYASEQKKDVHIHGLARVTGAFRAESRKREDWRFKHDAVIQPIDMDLPRDLVASALGKGSLREVIHFLEKSEFDHFANGLNEFGVHVEV